MTITPADVRDALLPLVRKGDDHTVRQLVAAIVLLDGPVAVHAVADMLGVNKPAATRIADRLEEDHYAVRVPNPSDRRGTLLRLTPSGRKFALSVGTAA